MTKCIRSFPQIERHPYEIIAFDWDGTAVESRHADAGIVTAALESLLKTGVYIVVITGTNFDNIDRQFSSLVSGTHKQNLFICANRGTEVFGFNSLSEPLLLYRRHASEQENTLLDRVAEAVKHDIEKNSGVTIDIVYDRLNRRKIDLIPEWRDPPKSRIGELEHKTQNRLINGGFTAGMHGAFELAEIRARDLGLAGARITSDVKHIEVGLTDKSDSMRWVIKELTRKRNTPLTDILVLGDEFGPVAGFEGSDYRMVLPETRGVSYISVGKEPDGVPEEVIYVGGGPACFLELMHKQQALQDKIAVTADDSFLLRQVGYNPLRERELESLFTVSNGYLGTRGSLEEQPPSSSASTLVAGIYDVVNDGATEELAVAPDWVFSRIYVFGKQLKLETDRIAEHRRVLDMKKGLLYRWWRHRDEHGRETSIQFTRLASLADHHATLMRISITPENYSGDISVETGISLCKKCPNPLEMTDADRMGDDGVYVTVRTRNTNETLSMAQVTRVRKAFLEPERSVRIDDSGAYERWRWNSEMGQELTIEKYIAIYTSRDAAKLATVATGKDTASDIAGNASGKTATNTAAAGKAAANTGGPQQEAGRHVLELADAGYRHNLLEHIDRWAYRWDLSGISINGSHPDQRGINFSVYHLISAGTPPGNGASISARSLTGTIYKGHIFWDAEVFILPFFTSTFPQSARPALMYRYDTLAAAREKAKSIGYRGALFAWESALTGKEMTPLTVIFPTGEVMEVASGKMEIHIDAAVAYGVWSYWNQTGDDSFLVDAGAELLIETARFWTSRAEIRDGEYHIFHVEGPDEYHENVDDNIYTNMMAAWNLRRASGAVAYMQKNYPGDWAALRQKLAYEDNEPDYWEDIAAKIFSDMKDGNLIEQFAGFFHLEDIDIKDYEPRTAPLDIILGRERTQASQVVKQADVVMVLYLLEDELNRQIISENFEYYQRRTSHGSSLSPAIYGLVAARLGLTGLALDYFHQAADIDLSNNMGNAAGGVHIAALGGLWQLIVKGFGGVRFDDERVWIYPQLPPEWPQLRFSLLWRRTRIDFDIERDRSILASISEGGGRVRLGVWGGSVQDLEGGKTYRAGWMDEQWLDFHEMGEEARDRE